MLEVRKGGGEEISLVQGKEQWLRFAGTAVKRYPMPKVRGGGREEQPNVQGVLVVWAQEGQEELTPHSRSGGADLRRYPSSKVRSSGYGLLEQP